MYNDFIKYDFTCIHLLFFVWELQQRQVGTHHVFLFFWCWQRSEHLITNVCSIPYCEHNGLWGVVDMNGGRICTYIIAYCWFIGYIQFKPIKTPYVDG
jgi:hypothetical protein